MKRAKAQKSPLENRSRVGRVWIGRNSVLVVTDSPEERLWLHVAGQRVCPELRFVFQGSAEAGLAYLIEGEPRGNLPRLVVVDYRSPSVGAVRFLQGVRSHPGLATLKVLVWTGREEPELHERMREAGVNGVLRKVERPEDLVENVRYIAYLARRTAAN